MRDILFKGKRLDNDEWIEGGIYQEPVDDIKNGQVYIIGGSLNDVGCAYPVYPSTVRQYTGLKDSTKWEELTTDEQKEWLAKHTADEWNGRPIFEGDLVRLDEYVKKIFDVCDGVIRYGRGGFYVGEFGLLNSLNTIADAEGILRGEVIGNIHDNPEFLEVEDDNTQ